MLMATMLYPASEASEGLLGRAKSVAGRTPRDGNFGWPLLERCLDRSPHRPLRQGERGNHDIRDGAFAWRGRTGPSAPQRERRPRHDSSRRHAHAQLGPTHWRERSSKSARSGSASKRFGDGHGPRGAKTGRHREKGRKFRREFADVEFHVERANSAGSRLALPSLPIEASVGLGRWIVALVVLASGRASGCSDSRRRLVRLRRDRILLARKQGARRRSDGPGFRRLSATRADGGRDDQGGRVTRWSDCRLGANITRRPSRRGCRHRGLRLKSCSGRRLRRRFISGDWRARCARHLSRRWTRHRSDVQWLRDRLNRGLGAQGLLGRGCGLPHVNIRHPEQGRYYRCSTYKPDECRDADHALSVDDPQNHRLRESGEKREFFATSEIEPSMSRAIKQLGTVPDGRSPCRQRPVGSPAKSALWR